MKFDKKIAMWTIDIIFIIYFLAVMLDRKVSVIGSLVYWIFGLFISITFGLFPKKLKKLKLNRQEDKKVKTKENGKESR